MFIARLCCLLRAQAARKELEGERVKAGKAVDQLKQRLAKATKAQHAAEVAAAEVRMRWLV